MNEKLDTEPRNRQNPPIPKQGVIFKTWGYSQGKSTLKWNFSACKKRFLNWNNIFKRIKQLLAKLRSLCLKIGLKIKVFKTFKISSDCHTKSCWSFKWRAIFEIFVLLLRRNYTASVGFKLKSPRKSVFLC